MKNLERYLLVFLLFIGGNAMATENSPQVSFVNNSDKLLKCSIKINNIYTPFIRLKPGSSKYFDGFELGSQVRCTTFIDKTQRSSTILTYFNVKTDGVYELLHEIVPCDTCTSKFRPATIVVFPNGESYYAKLSGE